MIKAKDILVVNTSSLQGIEVKKYLRPVNAHIVAGTNLFSDFFAFFSDVFGGRSKTYQNQLTSLYSDAVEKLKMEAYEIGANCILGLKIDLDEISGKGKSMFMITAVGTAVIIDNTMHNGSKNSFLENYDFVSDENIRILRQKKKIVESAENNTIKFDDNVWSFISQNQVAEVFDVAFKKLFFFMDDNNTSNEDVNIFYKHLLNYVDSLPNDIKINFLYKKVEEVEKNKHFLKVVEIIKDLRLLNLLKVIELLKNETFDKRKRATLILSYDKQNYSIDDIEMFSNISELIKNTFLLKGTFSTKKQLLSSKEKEVWICECGRTNDINAICSSCNHDIYGFRKDELTPLEVLNIITEKTSLLKEYFKSK